MEGGQDDVMTELLDCSSAPVELKRKRNTYSGLYKAKVVYELINGKRTLKELSEQYNVHPNQIKNWKSLLLKEASGVLDDKRRRRSQAEKLWRPTSTMASKYGKS
jgi:transposase